MTNFHFSKIVAGVGPTLAKETVISKIINMVEVFRISLGGGFDDNNKKYIDTVMKLDHSKTILLETRGNDVRVKNVINTKVKDKQTIEIEYSEYAQENNHKIFVDAAFLGNLKPGQIITFEQSGVKAKVKNVEEDLIKVEITTGGEIIQYDRVFFENFDPELPVFGERERKDILRGLEYGANVLSLSMVNNKNDIFEIKEFLSAQNADKMKVFAKIETKEAVKNFDEILEIADGVVLVFEKIKEFFTTYKTDEETLIKKCKDIGKPVIVTFTSPKNKEYKHINETELKKYCTRGVDCFMLNTLLEENTTLDIITDLSTFLEKFELNNKQEESDFWKNDDDNLVRDYIIYNAYRITNELEIKAIVSFTENGYTSARLSSLGPKVPVIAFTKTDETYRYLNMIRGVKGYKISPNFNYENLKRVGKEMIRIIFKGNISLDDKIIIVQANEIIKDEKTGMINGLELYKFKNI